jgi:biopolymer transport protein ExbD
MQFFGSWKNDGIGGKREVNLTPLIDVSLVLVVMLLLASPLAFESSINVNKADATSQKSKSVDEDERIEIIVVSDDTVRVNKMELPREEMSIVLKPLLDRATSRAVMIGCEPGVSHGAFVNTLDQAKMCGATQIAVFER